MPNAMDIEQVDRINETIRLRLAELDRIVAETEQEQTVDSPKSKIFDSLSTKLLLWQNRLREIAVLVKQAEESFHLEDDRLRLMLKSCEDLRRKCETVPETEQLSYITL